jgi:hypothetical protein
MRILGGLIIASLCAIAAATPARAIEELQDCDVNKDAGNRMACLQAHISHLEQTLLSLSTELVDIRHELKEKLAADGVYKLQYVGNGNCLGFADNDKPPVFGTCDRPDSWKLVRGSQLPGKTTTAPKPAPAPAGQSSDNANAPGQSSDNAPGKSPDKPKAQGKSADKQQGKITDQPQGKSSDQPKTVPQPN